MRFKNVAVLMAIPLTFVACSKSGGGGSGGSGGAVTPGSSISAQFIDSPVKGLKVEKASGNGETGANGMFTCASGEEVTFKLNDLVVGKASCGEKIYVSELDSANTDAVATLIQSLSISNSGQLDLTAFNTAAIALTGFDISGIGAIDSDISDLFTNNASLGNAGLAAVPLLTAQAHVTANLPTVDGIEDWIGSYPVTLNGASSNSADCWAKVSAVIELEDAAAVKPGAFKFNVTKYIGHDAAVDPLDVNLICDGEDHGNDGAEYECSNPGISKYLSGKKLNVSSYDKMSYSRSVGDRIACISPDREEYFSVSDIEQDCSLFNSYENVDLLTAFSKDFGYGYSFQVSLSASSLNLTYQEKNTDIYPDEDSFVLGTGGANHKANLVMNSYSCNYSYSETVDVGSSAAE